MLTPWQASAMFNTWRDSPLIASVSSPSPDLSPPINLIRIYHGPICPESPIRDVGGFLDVSWPSRMLPFCFWRLPLVGSYVIWKLLIFTSNKANLDYRLWQWYTYLLQTILDLLCYCEGVFLHQGKDSVICIDTSHQAAAKFKFNTLNCLQAYLSASFVSR